MTVLDDQKATKGFENLKFKYTGPKWDSHVHLHKMEDVQDFMKIAKDYNVQKITGIVREKKDEYEQNFPKHFAFARFIVSQNLFKSDVDAVIKDVEDMYNQGYPVVKMWYAPRWRKYAEEQLKVQVGEFRIDNPKLFPFYKKIEDLGLVLLIHVSDPDIFYKINYQPESYYGSKDRHMEEFYNVISHFPNLSIVGAHFGGQPEHLDRLGKWFDKFPNFYVDTSSARWMAREFSYEPEKVTEFFKKYKNHILFGTDIVTGRSDREPVPQYYYWRYLCLQTLFETAVEKLPLPINDPENDNKTVINGLNLPMNVLQQIYWKNSNKLFS